jgi:hypothetical protein
MRLMTILLVTLIMMAQQTTSGQDILNSGFEDWTFVEYFEDPDEYSTTNTVTFYNGSPANVTKTTDAQSGSYALRLETISTPDGVLEGAALIGEPGQDTFIGGIPYDQRPDSLTGYVKYNVADNDTAYVAAVFKKFGVPIGFAFGQFTGTQEEYQYFSVPIGWLVSIISPDTLSVALISSSIFAEPISGNVLYVDNVQFVGPGAPFPNGDFEEWTEFASEEAENWQSTNILTMPASSLSLDKTTDSHSGSYAARLESQVTNWDDTISFITNGRVGEEGPFGGMPVEDIPETLSGYYKYFPTDQDSAIASLSLYHYNPSTGKSDLLDEVIVKLPATNTYTYFEVPVDYNTLPEPDTINIAFGSGNFDTPGAFIGLGSTLYIDDLDITYKPHIVSVSEKKAASDHTVYPNPVKERLHFNLEDQPDKPLDVNIYDQDGQLVRSIKSAPSTNFSVDVSQLSNGIYLYRIKTGTSSYRGKFLVE